MADASSSEGRQERFGGCRLIAMDGRVWDRRTPSRPKPHGNPMEDQSHLPGPVCEVPANGQLLVSVQSVGGHNPATSNPLAWSALRLRRGPRSSSVSCGEARVTPRCRRAPIPQARPRDATSRTAPVKERGPSRVMRATVARCCPRGQSMRWSSTGRWAVSAAGVRRGGPGRRRASRRVTRSRSYRSSLSR